MNFQAYKGICLSYPKVKFKLFYYLILDIKGFLFGLSRLIFKLLVLLIHPSMNFGLATEAFFLMRPILLFLFMTGLSGTILIICVWFKGFCMNYTKLLLIQLIFWRDLLLLMGDTICNLDLGSTSTAGFGMLRNFIIYSDGDFIIIFFLESFCWGGVLVLIYFRYRKWLI